MRSFLSFFILYFFYHTSFAQIEVYTGSIDKYPIQVVFYKKTDGSIAGYYFYEKYKKNIPVKGTFINTDFKLCESLSYDVETCPVFFSGKKENNGTIKGFWKDENGSKNFSFSLFRTKLDESLYKRIKENEKRSGIYKSIEESQSFESTAEVIYLFNNLYQIELQVGSETCNGNVGFLADLSNKLTYKEKSKECKLILSFEKDFLIVKEEECMLHGMSCTFDGKYKKK